MKIEVVVLLYNRPEHAHAVFRSLEASGVTAVRAFMDAPGSIEAERNQERMLRNIASLSGLEVNLFRHRERQGLARSVRFALGTVFEDNDAAVLLEDDCVLRPGAIEFLTAGLRALRHDRRVRSLCAYLYPCNFIRGDGEPLMLRRFCTWGWATWRERWRDYDPDLRAVLQKLEVQGLHVDDFAADIAELCRSQAYLENRVDIWSLPWILEHYASGTFAVYPCDSLIENIGFDGSGENCEATSDFTAAARIAARPWNFKQLVHYFENEGLLKQFLDQHGLKAYPRV
jgi:hypothetical protein